MPLDSMWRFKVITHADSWIEIPGKYEDLQRVAYAIYLSCLKEGKISGDKKLPARWSNLMAGQGQNWPHHIFLAIKCLSVRWRPLGAQAKMPDGETIAEAILKELEWMKDEFAIPLVRDAGGEEKEAYPLIGDIMIRYLRALGDVLLTYIRDEQQFQMVER